MWPFDMLRKTEEIRADTDQGKNEGQEERAADMAGLEPDFVSVALLRALYGGSSIGRKEALQIPAVKGSIRLLADTVSSLPIKLYRKTDGKVEEVKDDHRIGLLNDDTGDTLTASQFWKAMIEDYFVGKGGYAYINKKAGRIESIHYVECEKVSHVKSPDPIFKDFYLIVQGQRYEPWEFMIILRNSKDGCTGTPIQEEDSLMLSAAYYSMRYEVASSKKGGSKKGFLQSERQLTKEQIDELKESWRRLYDSDEENMMILNKGLSYESAQNTAREMQLNEQRKTNREEISMLLGVPASILSGSAYAHDNELLIKHGLTPLLYEIESAIDKAMLTELEKEEGYYWAFDTREMTRGSIKERYEAYQIARQNNFLQVDEVRQLEDLEPLGFNFMTLGLDSVLMDPKTKMIYTPNTGDTKKLEEGGIMKNESGNQS